MEDAAAEEAQPVDFTAEKGSHSAGGAPRSGGKVSSGHRKQPAIAVGDLLKELDASRREVADSRDAALRAMADLDNYKKRMQRERAEIRNGAIGEVIEGLLPAVDNFELGLSAAEQHGGGSIVDGFAMILANLKSFLSSYGVREISPLHEKFDPNFHDCVRRVAVDGGEGEVIVAVDRKGYALNGRLLRPAMVAVSQVDERQNSAQ